MVHDVSGGRVACSPLRPEGDILLWHLGGCYKEEARLVKQIRETKNSPASLCSQPTQTGVCQR